MVLGSSQQLEPKLKSCDDWHCDALKGGALKPKVHQLIWPQQSLLTSVIKIVSSPPKKFQVPVLAILGTPELLVGQ